MICLAILHLCSSEQPFSVRCPLQVILSDAADDDSEHLSVYLQLSRLAVSIMTLFVAERILVGACARAMGAWLLVRRATGS